MAGAREERLVTLIEKSLLESTVRNVDTRFGDLRELSEKSDLSRVRTFEDAEKRLEISRVRENAENGLARQETVKLELKEHYPEEHGYKVLDEPYLRDGNGQIVRDPISEEGRRIDFVVVKGNEVVDSIEVTSPTVDKTAQLAKEQRIREAGGNYIKDPHTGQLYEIPADVVTRVERRP